MMMTEHIGADTRVSELRRVTSPSVGAGTMREEGTREREVKRSFYTFADEWCRGVSTGSSPAVSRIDAKSRSKRQWGEEELERLAIDNPSRLLELLRSSDVHDADLSFAAEKAGVIDSDDAVEALLSLLDHAAPLVREGAIYGLAAREFPDRRMVQALRLHRSPLYESSPGVREAAAEALEVLGY
jgi:hypothetical protein